jgi:hypothetical protein
VAENQTTFGGLNQSSAVAASGIPHTGYINTNHKNETILTVSAIMGSNPKLTLKVRANVFWNENADFCLPALDETEDISGELKIFTIPPIIEDTTDAGIIIPIPCHCGIYRLKITAIWSGGINGSVTINGFGGKV